jgi:AraC-like DNA-binding protein
VTPLAGIFPTMAIIREEELTRHAWLKATLDQQSSEYLAQGPGSELIVNKLTEVVLIELIRINFCRDEDNSFLAALNDSFVSKALNLLHERPQHPWTLDSLAAEVALSRAAFAKRFKSMVGQSMFQYLTSLRMQKASDLLITTQLPVYEISSRSGYESELAFTRTFKKHAGVTPKQFRKQRSPASR